MNLNRKRDGQTDLFKIHIRCDCVEVDTYTCARVCEARKVCIWKLIRVKCVRFGVDLILLVFTSSFPRLNSQFMLISSLLSLLISEQRISSAGQWLPPRQIFERRNDEKQTTVAHENVLNVCVIPYTLSTNALHLDFGFFSCLLHQVYAQFPLEAFLQLSTMPISNFTVWKNEQTDGMITNGHFICL